LRAFVIWPDLDCSPIFGKANRVDSFMSLLVTNNVSAVEVISLNDNDNVCLKPER
jgi:hypothetical protein